MSYQLKATAHTNDPVSAAGAQPAQRQDSRLVCITPDGLPVIIDVEASGFGHGSYPIEVAFILADGSVEQRLIKPLECWAHWDEQAQALHGISHATLMRDGEPASEVALWLNDKLADIEIVYSDSWGFDSSWIGRLFNDTHIIQRFRLDSLRKLLKERQLAHWDQARRKVEKRLGLKRHRAANDVRILQATFSQTL